MLAATLFAAGAATLVVAASLSYHGGARMSTQATFEAGFGLIACGIAAVLRVGLAKVVAHRRGGRAHVELDVRRTRQRGTRWQRGTVAERRGGGRGLVGPAMGPCDPPGGSASAGA